MPNPSTEKTEKTILRLSTAKFRWMTAGEDQRLEELFDNNLIFINMAGKMEKKRDWLLQMRQGVFRYEQIVPKQMSARVYSDSAVVVGRAIFVVHMHGFKSRWNIIFTEVYALKEDGWKLTNVHASTC